MQNSSKAVDLSSFSNPEYNPGKGVVVQLLWYMVNAVFFKSYLIPFSGFKVALLRLFGAKVGLGVVVKPAINIKYPWKLSIGNHVWIGEEVWIDNLANVTIEDNVCVSQGAYLLTGNHNYKKPSFDLITAEITLKHSSWVGAKSIVCPSVTLEEGAILTVGSVATNHLTAWTIYQGNPAEAKKMRTLE